MGMIKQQPPSGQGTHPPLSLIADFSCPLRVVMSLAGAGCSTTIGFFAGGSLKYGCGEGDDMVVVVVVVKG